MKELTELEQQTVEEELLNIPTPSISNPAGTKDKVPGLNLVYNSFSFAF